MAAKKKIVDSPEEFAYYDQRALDRLTFFSDAVFAIAITLLVLNVTVPVILPSEAGTELTSALLATAPKFYSYVLSFLVIGGYWMAHQRTFHYVVRYDRGLASLNLLFLLFIALIPFPTGVLSVYGDQLIAAILYAATLALIGLLLSLLWFYISHHHRLLAKTVRVDAARVNMWRNLSPPIVFLASIGVAFVSIPIAELMWPLAFIIPVAVGLHKDAI
ncbi:MAG TPA: TMEM175 family protein [archaeon]|jgi:Predicted integral membrane protein